MLKGATCAEPPVTLARPVDLQHLARYTGGDRSVNAEVLSLFISQLDEILARLDTALQDEDTKAWREVAHSLKGAARGIGAFELGDLAAILEATNPAAQHAEAASALHKLRSRSLTVTLFIEAYLGR
jgi:HPt (histidine-containing phosphotransfer) domain-containing protein